MIDNRKKHTENNNIYRSYVGQTVTEIKQKLQVSVQSEIRRQSWSLFNTFLNWILRSWDELEVMTWDDGELNSSAH